MGLVVSADNWAQCPRCKYNGGGEYNFREDYEFYGAESGTLKFYYSGLCSDCGLSLVLSEHREFWTPPQATLEF